jgi:hypothetical protein
MDYSAGVRPIIRLGWWVALGMYLLFCIFVAVKS